MKKFLLLTIFGLTMIGCNNDNEPIIARQYKQIGYAFKDKIDKYYVWVAELKEMFAQHIVAAYTSQLSRVGIDNSEWIRLVGKMN